MAIEWKLEKDQDLMPLIELVGKEFPDLPEPNAFHSYMFDLEREAREDGYCGCTNCIYVLPGLSKEQKKAVLNALDKIEVRLREEKLLPYTFGGSSRENGEIGTPYNRFRPDKKKHLPDMVRIIREEVRKLEDVPVVLMYQ